MSFGIKCVSFLAIFIALVITNLILRNKKAFWKSIKQLFTGPAMLITLNWICSYFEVKIPLNMLSTGVSALLGLPGIASGMFLNYILN